MTQPTLTDLINQSLQLLEEIQQHPDFKNLEYAPDLTIGDAEQALIELKWQTIPQPPTINLFSLEGFSS